MRAPFWTLGYLRTPEWRFPNIEGYVDESTQRDFGSIAEWFREQLDRGCLWEDAAKIREEWRAVRHQGYHQCRRRRAGYRQ